MKVINEYDSHHYIEEFLPCDLFCPNCGYRSVWREQSPGDYYVGQEFICTACAHDFTIQGPDSMIRPNELKMLAQLKSGKTLTPTTPPGH